MQPRQLVVLLRGINVGGHRKVPMADLRKLATDLGYTGVRTYIASGNLLITTDATRDQVDDALGQAIEDTFGFAVDLILVEADRFRELAAGGTFPDAERDRPKFLHLGFGRRQAPPGASEAIEKYARGDERVAVAGDVVWLDYANGAGRSKISPQVLDRAFDCPVTCRNFRSLQKIAEMLGD